MILNIPYFSMMQHVADDYWKVRACGIACLQMVIANVRPEEQVTMEGLLHEGQVIGGFTPHGWLHSHLAMILRNHGVLAYAQEFRTANPATQPQFSPSVYTEEFVMRAIQKIVRELDAGRPVILSIPGHQRLPGQTHMVVCTGYEGAADSPTGFYYNDPQDDDGQAGQGRPITLEDFQKDWRRFCIFVE